MPLDPFTPSDAVRKCPNRRCPNYVAIPIGQQVSVCECGTLVRR